MGNIQVVYNINRGYYFVPDMHFALLISSDLRLNWAVNNAFNAQDVLTASKAAKFV